MVCEDGDEVQGTFPGFSSQWSKWCLSSFTENHSLSLTFFLGELKAFLMGQSVPLICVVSGFHAEVEMTKSQQSWI